MSTAYEHEVVEEVLAKVKKISAKQHFSHLVDSYYRLIKIETDSGTAQVVYVEVGPDFRITTFGLVAKQPSGQEAVVVGHTVLCELGINALNALSGELDAIIERCRRVFGHVV